MPYRPKDIYRGRRKFRVPLAILLFVLAFLLIGGVGLFYFLQQFLVYDQNGVTLTLPFLAEEQAALEDAEPTPDLSPVDVEVVYDEPDFSDIDLRPWEGLEPTRARFIPFSAAGSASSVNAVVSSLSDEYTGVVIEVKDRSGYLTWPSQTEMAAGYGAAGSADYTEIIEKLHEKGLTAAAQMSCCADDLMGLRNWPLALLDGSDPYRDESGGYWLDPYNIILRNYLEALMRELADMGFDEIILADLYHPVTDVELTYSVTVRPSPDPVNAVCQMARRLAESLADTDTAVSARVSASSLRNDRGARTGQELSIFWRIFARLYCPTDYWSAASDEGSAVRTMAEGDSAARFVPVSEYAPPDFSSYVIES